jgi:hypothetical protein
MIWFTCWPPMRKVCEMLKPVLAVFAALVVVGAMVPAPAVARVRVHHHSAPSAAPLKLNIPDLPAIDYKGLTNADALTVAIGKTPLLATAAPAGKPLGNLVRGTHLKKLGQQGGYWQVETADHKRGFVIKYAVAMGKITLNAAPASTLGFVTVNAPGCKVYAMAGTKTPVVGNLAAKAKVPHLFTMAGFYKVKTPQGKIGWIEKGAGVASAK